MSETLPILYSFRRCPYAIRARMAVKYAGIPVELREVVLRDKPADMLRYSPKGTVPVLILKPGEPGEQVIDESLDVMHWALAQRDDDNWLSAYSDAARALVAANDNDFKPWLDRYKYPNRYDDIGGADPAAHCLEFITELDRRLAGQPYLFGANMSAGDIAIFPFIRQYAFVDIDEFRRRPLPAIQRWLDGLLNADVFTRVMQKYPAWKSGDPQTVF
jgi:glutathione S-transferase